MQVNMFCFNLSQIDLNSSPRRKLEETTGTSLYYMDENHSAGSEIKRPQYGRRSWLGSEPSTLEIDVYVRRYALLVVLSRNDDDDDHVHKLLWPTFQSYDWKLGRDCSNSLCWVASQLASSIQFTHVMWLSLTVESRRRHVHDADATRLDYLKLIQSRNFWLKSFVINLFHTCSSTVLSSCITGMIWWCRLSECSSE